MSELIQTNDNRATIRWKLLTGASALALAAYMSSASLAAAEDASQPQIWIELGGQAERVDDSQGAFLPPFFALASSPAILAPMTDVQKPAPYSFGESGKITYAPENSDWLFSASLRYGRSSASKHKHYETAHPNVPFVITITITGVGLFKDAFGDGQGTSKESHLILDFQAGKDVGLGLFGKDGKSVVSAGVRFAQFTTTSDASLHARPYYVSLPPFGSRATFYLHSCYYWNNTAVIQAKRDTRAVGPELSWDASVPFAGNASDMEITFDWGINAALLFGRQRASVHHQTKGSYFRGIAGRGYITATASTYSNPRVDRTRSRNVTIPNVGGFAGFSLKFPNAKVSIGYRYDTFIGAMDTGFDAAKKSNLTFNGPFASISVGIGD